jgi:hypothetical protein
MAITALASSVFFYIPDEYNIMFLSHSVGVSSVQILLAVAFIERLSPACFKRNKTAECFYINIYLLASNLTVEIHT